MKRVASLYLPQLPIERLLRLERKAGRPEPGFPAGVLAQGPRFQAPIDDDPGECSVPRGGGWRPGARWARTGDISGRPAQAAIDALPAHQRPTMREMGRRSEAADPPFSGTSTASAIPARQPQSQVLAASRPIVLTERTGQREVVTAACPAALNLGLRPGMAAAEARALIAHLDVRDADAGADRIFLDRLALHAVGRWTPIACPSDLNGLWLDLTGTTHLFGGEASFCRRTLQFLRRLGFSARIAIAGTAGAAYALARYGGHERIILAAGQEAAAIADLPLAALRLQPDALVAAGRFGFERIADLYAVARAPLARRLGTTTVARLDQARGFLSEPITPLTPFEMPVAERRLLEPIGTPEAIAQVIDDLVDDLVATLQARHIGLRAAVLTCQRVDGEEQRIGLGTARATRDARHLKRMFAMRVERIQPELGIEMMSLTAPRVEALAPAAFETGLGGGEGPADIALLVDQLAGRVGENALFRMTAVESDVPERAVRRLNPLESARDWPSWKRPVRMLSSPEPVDNVVALLPDHPPRRFDWRGRAWRVVAGDGPERVHGEWWRTDAEMWAVRDYFRVETEEGMRLWLFRRGDGVEAATGDLSWYVHGMFG